MRRLLRATVVVHVAAGCFVATAGLGCCTELRAIHGARVARTQWWIGPALTPPPQHIHPPFAICLDEEHPFGRFGILLDDGPRMPAFTEVRWLLNDAAETGLPQWVLAINEGSASAVCLVDSAGKVLAQHMFDGIVLEVRPIAYGGGVGLLVTDSASGTNYHGGGFSLLGFDGRCLKTLAKGPRYGYRSMETDRMTLSMPIILECGASRRLLVMSTIISDIPSDDPVDLEMASYHVDLKEVVWDDALSRFRATACPAAQLLFPDPNTAWRWWDSYGALPND